MPRRGEELWRRTLTSRGEQFIDIAPVVWNGLVFLSTIGYPPFGRGAIYALDAADGCGAVEVRDGQASVAASARGRRRRAVVSRSPSTPRDGSTGETRTPRPGAGRRSGRTAARFRARSLYTDSLLVLDARDGRLLWHDQVTPHDVRDYDFQATPILVTHAGIDLVLGAGKAGRVIAWDRETRRRRWAAVVGMHRNDVGPLPRRPVTVCPGLLGGVETPMAYADGRLFVPVVDLCGWGSAVGRQELTDLDPSSGRGRLVALDAATGSVLWERRLPSPDFGCATVSNDVVFTSTYDGTVYALSVTDGTILWRATMRAGVNACPAVVGDLLLVGAGVRRGNGERSVTELVAFGLE